MFNSGESTIDWKNLPKADFGIWPNQYKKTSKHPDKVGHIEINETLLKGMLSRAKAGEMPVLSVAVWPRKSLDGKDYENAQVQLKPSKEELVQSKSKEAEEPKVEGATFNWD